MESVEQKSSEQERPILLERRGAVAILTFNRPARMNAWTVAMEQCYLDLLHELENDGEIRAVVVTGSGRAYCVGADVGELQDMGTAGGNDNDGAGQTRPLTATIGFRKPVIAAINGSCAGIGLVQAMGCDVRFAAAGVKFTTAYAKLGLVAEDGTSWLLPHLVGHARALDLLLSGRVFLSEEAAEMGLVSKVVAPEELLATAIAYADELATNCSPAAMAKIKELVWRHATADLSTALEEAWNAVVATLRTADFREGTASFLERRPPHFEPLPPL